MQIDNSFEKCIILLPQDIKDLNAHKINKLTILESETHEMDFEIGKSF